MVNVFWFWGAGSSLLVLGCYFWFGVMVKVFWVWGVASGFGVMVKGFWFWGAGQCLLALGCCIWVWASGFWVLL